MGSRHPTPASPEAPPARRVLAVEVKARPADGGFEPEALALGSRRVAVTAVLDRWFGRGYRYFKVAGSDGATYILRRNDATGTWSLTLYRRREMEG